MQNFRTGTKLTDAVSHAIIKSDTNTQNDIAAMHRHVGFIGTVHTQHAKELTISRRVGSKPHQRIGAGHTSHAHEFAEQA